MQKITPFLWFDGNADEAIKLYTSIFKDSKVLNERRFGDTLFTATFQLNGQQFMALNGGPMFKFTEAVSLFVNCDTQEEVDYYWSKLTENGGQESRCGWLKDKFGLSWQIIPSTLGALLGDPNPVKAKNVMDAMLQMSKLDIKLLEQARDKE